MKIIVIYLIKVKEYKMYLTEEEIAIYEKEVLLKEDKEILFEMTNLRKKHTGLPMNIWLDDIGAYRNIKHNVPRIKFQNDKSDKVLDNTIPISIDKENPQILTKTVQLKLPQKDFKKLYDFIKDNYDLLIKFWNQEIDIFEFMSDMKKAPQ